MIAVSSAPRKRKGWLRLLGPGLITGASDDDPSGIATYSQAGAQFGFGLTWLLLFSYPLMAGIQQIGAQIGRVTGLGLAGNMRRHYPPWVLNLIVGLLVIANTINLGADLGAMGAALKLLVGGPALIYVVAVGAVSVLLETFLSYARYVSVLKWLTLSLFSYVATVFVVDMPWGAVGWSLVWPKITPTADYLTTMVALFGTTISPYLFFWQAGQEVEEVVEQSGAEPLLHRPGQARAAFVRIRLDTYVGMGFSNLIALFILITAAATLNAHGVTDIQTSAQAAEALRPIAGDFAFAVFAIGIVGTGLLALPVLAGSAAYAIGEARGWPVGLGKRAGQAKAFYGTIAVSTAVGIALNFTPIDPVRALFWTAVINGVVAVPVMIMMMRLAARRDVMGRFVIGRPLALVGWLATAVMAAAAFAMVATW